ncbi:glycoside hydrolase family 3 N-terminal domain-containing protein [Streptomyces sp. 7R007]
MNHRRIHTLHVAALGAAGALLATACASAGPDPVAASDPTGSPSATHAGSLSAATTGAASDATTGPAGPAVTKAACTNRSQLARWSDRRLAMLTIVVPVSESAVSGVTAEVTAGAGGVLLFGGSAPADLGARLTTLKSHVPGHLGLLVMTDEEGGDIQRMANLVGSLPWAASMGAHWTPAQIRRNVGKVAARMSAAQVNTDLAPVVDVDGRNTAPSRTNPDGWRSFSGSTAKVTEDGLAYLNGLRDGHVIPVLKHFPGLGGSSYNSDYGPAHTLPWSTLVKVGIPPFSAAIKAGAPAVMVSNDTVPGLATNPASLSPTTITYELRGKLGFKGLVLTDSLSAKAISAAGYSVPHAAVQALRSGADMVMFGLVKNVAGQTSATASAITSAVADGRLTRARLIDAASHVLAVRHVNLCSS